MASYNFTKAGITKPPAFDAYLRDNFAYYEDFTYTDPDLTVDTTIVLSPAQETDLQTLVDNYTDPAVFLVLDYTGTDAFISDKTNSSNLEPMLSFIFYPKNPLGTSVFSALKHILEYSTPDVADFLNPLTIPCTVTFTIYDFTRSTVIATQDIDISAITTVWNGLAVGLQTGPIYELQTFMFEGLRDLIANYDCIWQLKISTDNPLVFVRSMSMQRLYYTVW